MYFSFEHQRALYEIAEIKSSPVISPPPTFTLLCVITHSVPSNVTIIPRGGSRWPFSGELICPVNGQRKPFRNAKTHRFEL